MLTLIYALVDPPDDSVRYVGRTKDPYARMYAHLGDRRADGSPKQRWMHELRELRLRPRMAVDPHLRAPRVYRAGEGGGGRWLRENLRFRPNVY